MQPWTRAGTLRLEHYDITYCSTGPPHQRPILFLHGFMGNCDAFAAVIAQLAEQYGCWAVDIPGHGQTRVAGGLDSYRMETVAQGIVQFLDAQGTVPCALVGYSMGGRLALYLALQFPDYFSRVVLESASPGLQTAAERAQRRQRDEQLAQALETMDFPKFLNRWYGQPLFDSLRAHADFEQMLASRLSNDPQALARSLRGMGTGSQPSLWPPLSTICTPLLLVVGSLDAKFIAINRTMAALCDSAHLEIVQGCGHNVHVENPAVFAQTVSQFLAHRS